VRDERAREPHAVIAENVEEFRDAVGGINGNCLARFPITNQVNEVDHLLRDHVVAREVSSREQLPEVHSVLGHRPHLPPCVQLEEDGVHDFLALAETQYGVVARDQLDLSKGQIDNLLRSGRLLRMYPGVYRIPGAPQTDRQRAMAACLWINRASVSHLSAGSLLRLDSCKNNRLDLGVPHEVRRRAPEGVVIHHLRGLERGDRVWVDGIPCTSATRTLIDCAPLLGEEALEAAFESARRMGLTSVRALERRITQGRPGGAALRKLLAHQRPTERAVQYRLEVKMARLFRASALPRPERQFPVGRYHIDFAYPPILVGVECEGYEFHGGRLAWKRDKARTAWLEAQGWRLVFVTWDDVTQRPEQTLHRIELARVSSHMRG
jgi:very-short-patch-repair endonuclease